MLGSFVLALSVATPASNVDPATAAWRVARCGLGAVTTRNDELLRETVLVPANAKSATDEQLACVARAAGSYDVDLPSPLAARFQAMREARFRALVTADATRRLARRGLRAPVYREGRTDPATFTRTVERRCGAHARGAFGSTYGPTVLNSAWIEREAATGDGTNSALSCVVDMAVVAGFPFGFIGNESRDPAEPHQSSDTSQVQ